MLTDIARLNKHAEELRIALRDAQVAYDRMSKALIAYSPESDTELVRRLKEWRLHAKNVLGVPPYCVFPDRALKVLSADMPQTEEDLLGVLGLGPARVHQFGPAILSIIRGDERIAPIRLPDSDEPHPDDVWDDDLGLPTPTPQEDSTADEG